jgi:hypothetical protein
VFIASNIIVKSFGIIKQLLPALVVNIIIVHPKEVHTSPPLTKFSKYHSYIVSSVLYMLLVEEIGGPGEKTSTSST